MLEKLKYFVDNGFIKLDNLLDKRKCAEIYENIKNNRNWGVNLFQSEQDFLNEFKDKPFNKINPGKGIQNLVDEYNLDFIEKNNSVIQVLNKILGVDYEIILSKFVVSN